MRPLARLLRLAIAPGAPPSGEPWAAPLRPTGLSPFGCSIAQAQWVLATRRVASAESASAAVMVSPMSKPGRRYGEWQSHLDQRPRVDSNGRVLVQLRVDVELYDKAFAAARALNVSRRRLYAELLRRLEVDEAGRPVGWEDVAMPAGGDSLPLSA